MQFVDRANAVDAFKPSYDIGAMAQGSVAAGKFAYSAGIFNGTGQSGTRTNNSGAWKSADGRQADAGTGAARVLTFAERKGNGS